MKTRYSKTVTIDGVVCQIDLTRDYKSETKMVHNRILHEDVSRTVVEHRCEGYSDSSINVVVAFTDWSVEGIKTAVKKCETELIVAVRRLSRSKLAAGDIVSAIHVLGFEQTMP